LVDAHQHDPDLADDQAAGALGLVETRGFQGFGPHYSMAISTRTVYSNRIWKAPRSRKRPYCYLWRLVATFLLAGVGEAIVPTVQGRGEDDIKALRQLENDIAQAWVQRDSQTLDRILADDYTFVGAGDVLINKEQWVAGVDYPGIRTTSAIVDDLRIRVYGDAAVVTGRAIYRGRSKESGEFVRRFRFTDTFIRRDSVWKCVASHASALPPK
jgi:ketosteroid isomerase-like protein